MTNNQIDKLIAARNRITDRRDEQIDYAAVDAIDAVLSEVEPGTRNDVDLLLGRSCAVLPQSKRIIAVQHRDGTRETATKDGWLINAAIAVEAVKPLADAKLAQYKKYQEEA